MEEELSKVRYAFWDMADILADNLPEGTPYDDPETSAYITECQDRFENDKRDFESAMEILQKYVAEHEG